MHTRTGKFMGKDHQNIRMKRRTMRTFLILATVVCTCASIVPSNTRLAHATQQFSSSVLQRMPNGTFSIATQPQQRMLVSWRIVEGGLLAQTTVQQALEQFKKTLSQTAMVDIGSQQTLRNALVDLAKSLTDATTDEQWALVHDAYMTTLEQIRTALPPNANQNLIAVAMQNATVVVERAIELYTNAGLTTAETSLHRLIESAGSLLAKIPHMNRQTKLFVDTLQRATELLVDRTATIAENAEIVGESAKATLTSNAQNEGLTKIANAFKLSLSLQTKFDALKIARFIDAKFIIQINAAVNVESVETTIPIELIAAVENTRAGAIELRTPLMTMAFLPSMVRQLPTTARTVTFKFEKTKITDEKLRTLRAPQKQLLGNNDILYTISGVTTTRNETQERIRSFKEPVALRIPYPLKDGENPDQLTAMVVTEEGTIDNKVTKYDSKRSNLYFITNNFDEIVIKQLNPVFLDVSRDYWGEDYIASMAAKGIVQGRGFGKFEPKGNITRAEFAKMIVLVTGVPGGDIKSIFKDVPDRSWFAPFVNAGNASGFISGYPDGYFRPKALISREEMAVIISRVLAEPIPLNVNDIVTFRDRNAIAPYARSAVAIALRAQIIEGKANNVLMPKEKATRAEATTMIYRLFNY